MAVKPFTKEELNFFKFASIVHDEFPKMLRSTFVTLWNSKIAPGYQVWDDTPAVRTLLLTLEGGTTAIPTNKSFKDWDCTALFKATIYSKTFAISTTTNTLYKQFIEGKIPSPSPFHASLIGPTGSQDEILTIAIDQVRQLRNHLSHLPASSMTKPDFDNCVQLAKDAFTALKFSTGRIDHIGSLDEADFPTERVNELNKRIRDMDKDIPSTSIINSNCQTVVNIIGDNNVINLQNSEMEGKNPGKIDQEHQQKFISPKKNPSKNSQSCVKSCIPDKPDIFIGRDAKVKQIISSLVEDGCGIVSIVGGPGFGKSTIAIEVSHQLSNDHGIVVIFSFMSHASTVSEVLLRLCNDVCVNPGENPESSLRFWLTGVATKVVLVMDNIEQLLESHVKSQFVELVRTLRKNSQQRLQILTTTRTEFSVPGQITASNHRVDELDVKSGVELLRMCCPHEEIEDGSLSELAKLCGFVPLALCIAGKRIPDLDDPSEMIKWLNEKPMEALRDPDQCVHQAIEFSFQKLSDEDKKGLVCLSVYKGDFERRSAEKIIKRNEVKTLEFLWNLVNRSLIQVSSDKRFVVHSLIRRFLTDHEEFQDEKALAQELMVKHFLKACHSLTVDCYSRDGFTPARKSLKKDVHNIEEILKICSQDQATSSNPNILEFLASSDIYKSSSWYFYNISWDLLPDTVLTDLFKSCIKLAESRLEPTIGITFQCLVADQEGRMSGWKSPEYVDRMQGIREAFHKYETELRAERSLFEFCYYFLARYDSNKPANTRVPPDLPETDLDNKELSTIRKASEPYILMERGNLSKARAEKVRYRGEEYFKYMERARSIYDRALEKAEEVLKDHELTCILHKLLGDLFLALHKNDDALKCYFDSIKLRVKLELDSNEAFVFLRKNYGACLYYLGRFEESVEILMKARDIADKLTDKHTVCKSRVYFVLAKAYRNWKPDCQEAARYAKQAMEMRELLNSYMVEKLEKIILIAAENIAKLK